MVSNTDPASVLVPSLGSSNSAQLQPALTHLPVVGVAVFDEHLNFVSLNSALASMTGMPLDVHYGTHIRGILGSASKRVELALEVVMDSQKSLVNLALREKFPGRQAVGSWIATLAPLVDKTGRVKGAIGFGIEIAGDWPNENLAVCDGYLVTPPDIFELLGRSEKVIAEQAKLNLLPHWTPHSQVLRNREKVIRTSSPNKSVFESKDLNFLEVSLRDNLISHQHR